MKCISTIILFLLPFYSFSQNTFNGVYEGLEKLCWDSTKENPCINTIEEDSAEKWYRLCLLKIKGDSAYMDQSPISIKGNDTSYSASDGGFYYYWGTVTKKGDSIIINLEQKFCDYCGIKQNGIVPVKKLIVTKVGKNIIANGILYRRIKTNSRLISETWLPGKKKTKKQEV